MALPPELLEFDKDPNQPLYADHLYAQHKGLTEAMMGIPFFETYDNTFAKGAPAAITEDRHQYISEELEALHTAVQESMGYSPDEAAANVEVMGEVSEQIVEEAHSPLFVVNRITEALAEDIDLPVEVLEYNAEQLYYGYILSDVFDKNFWGTARDFAGMLWTDLAFTTARVTGRTGIAGWIHSGRDLQALSHQFRMAPLEDRLEMFYDLVDEVKNETPNAIKAMMIINAVISDEGYERIQFDQMLDKIGLVSWAFDAASLGVFAGRRLAHPIRVLGHLKNEQRAMDIAVDALRTEEARAIMQMDQTDAAAHLSPVVMGDALFEGMPTATKGELARRMAQTQEAFSEMPRMVLTEGMESLVDPALAHSRAERAIRANEEGLTVTNVQVMDYGPRGLTLRYQVMSPDSPTLAPDIGPHAPQWQQDALRLAEQTDTSWREIARQVGKPKSTVSDFLRKNYYPRQRLQGPTKPAFETVTVEVPYTTSDIPGYGFNPEVHRWRTPLIHHLASPAYKFQDEMESLVRVMQRGMFQSGKWRNMFQKQYSEIWHMAPREQRMKVGQALEQGNVEGRVYSYNDLRGMGINDEGAAQYFAFRELMDQAWLLKNRELADMHIAAGHHWFNLGTRPTPVSIYDTPQAAEGSIRQAGATNVLVFDDTATQGHRLNLRATPDGAISPKLQEYLNDGYVLMRPQTEMGIYEHMGEGFRFILARRTETRPIQVSDRLIDYHVGYVPIFYGPPGKANYFGQVARYGTVDGQTTKVGESTKVYFANRTDADQWARDNNLRHVMERDGVSEAEALRIINDPENAPTLPYNIKHDREIRQHEFDTWYAGGPYSGHRSTERLRMGVTEESAQYLDPFTAMQRYLDHLANHMPLSAYRIGLEDKWMKHARHHNALPKSFTGGFREARARVAAEDGRRIGADVKQFLLDSHDHITFNNRVASLGEQNARGWMITTAERMEKILGKDNRFSTFLHHIDQVHMPDLVRAVTFHSLLGIFSPAQYVVQASGATVAFSADPTNFVKGMPYAFAIKALDNVPDLAMRGRLLDRIEEFLPGTRMRYEAWQKTGLHDAVVSTSADYRAVVNSYPTGPDLYQRAVGETARATDKAAFFYKAGELVNRRFSFATAMERHLAKGGKLDDAGIKLALNDANKFMLNMDRAVKANFQKGWWGVPTQFMQVHTKFMENLIGKQLTGPERARLLAMQVGTFGALGVPFGTSVLVHGLTAAGVGPGDLSEGQLQFARGGMANYLLSEVMGFNVEVASRTAIPHGISETFTNLFIDNPSFWETLSGAAGSLPQRSLEFGRVMYAILHANEHTLTNIDSTDAVIAGQAFLEIASSGRSAVAAWHMFNNDQVRTDRGILLNTDDFTTREKIARGMGFQLNEVADMREWFRTKKFRDQYIREKTDLIADYMARRWNVEGTWDPDAARKMEALLTTMSATAPHGTQEAIRRQLEGRIFTGQTLLDQSNREFAESILNENWHHLQVLSRQYPRGED